MGAADGRLCLQNQEAGSISGFSIFPRPSDVGISVRKKLRLNRRFAPKMYEDVVGITGTPDDPFLDGPGQPFEHAVRMRQFADADRLDHVLMRGELLESHIDNLAAEVARQHAAAAVAGDDEPFGRPELVRRPVVENFAQIRARLTDSVQRVRLEQLDHWTQAEFKARLADIQRRKTDGIHPRMPRRLAPREYGAAGRPRDTFRLSGIQRNLAVDRRAERSGLCHHGFGGSWPAGPAMAIAECLLRAFRDYAGLAVLPYYLVYRALVRATVASIRASQADLAPDERAASGRNSPVSGTGGTLCIAADSALLITHGLSGGRKTHFTQRLLEQMGAVRIRSDVERKRLAGLPASARTTIQDLPMMYGEAANQATYERLSALARHILTAASAVVDATFLRQTDRNTFRDWPVKCKSRF